MSVFKDAAASDIKRVFLNADEFSDYHDIDGERVLCQIDKNVTKGAAASLEGVFINSLTIYVSSEDIEKPVEGQILSVDGSMHSVRSVSDEMGVLVIVAEVNEQ